MTAKDKLQFEKNMTVERNRFQKTLVKNLLKGLRKDGVRGEALEKMI